MAAITDVYVKLRDVALADDTLKAMLGATTAFYYGADLPITPPQPFIVVMQADDVPNQSDSFWGDFRPRVEIQVVGTDPAVLHAIVGRLDDLFVIPFKRNSPIEATTFVIRQMLRTHALLLPMVQREADGLVFQQLVTEWQLKVTAKS